ncbi:hypothetical protein [Paenibacillus sp. FSL F4-0097]|uniref:hypothetical protein n=1 Tax=Paenibacillus sp. FSL F4-0097 TaxID=2921369 RepID=UPI003158515F
MRFVGIDPATTTGFVALDEEGNVLVATDVKGVGKRVPGGISIGMLVSLENKLYNLLKPGDIVAIEESAKKTQRGVTTGMIHGGLRSMLYRKGLEFVDVNPQRTKGFVNRNQRVTSSEKKKHVAAGVLEHYGYEHSSDNVTDAYIIAKIAQALYAVKNGGSLELYTSYQQRIIKAIISPEAKAPVTNNEKSQTTKRTGKPAAAGSHTHLKEQQFLF